MRLRKKTNYEARRGNVVGSVHRTGRSSFAVRAFIFSSISLNGGRTRNSGFDEGETKGYNSTVDAGRVRTPLRFAGGI